MRGQSGLTIVESMVAMMLLLVGILGTVKLIDVANANGADAKAREGATNLARELLEDAHDRAYSQMGAAGWMNSSMTSIQGGSGTLTNPDGHSVRTTVSRRNFTYQATISWCSVDDSKDLYGPHSASVTWCSDSTSTGTSDTLPEDMKRISATVTYSINGKPQTLTQTIVPTATGGVITPAATSLQPWQPTLTQANGVWLITSGTTERFRATAPGAADVKFSVNGVDVTSGVTNNNDGTFDFDWGYSGLTDGVYTIGATAVDALGNKAQPVTLQVKLARGAPVVAQQVVGGYNYVNPTGVGNGGSLVVELQWDANPEGSVTGYEVLKGITSVCGGQTSLATSCIDTTPAQSGSTTYTVKTWYRDSNGAMQFVSTTITVSAPSTVQTDFWWANSTTISQTKCTTPPVGSKITPGAKKDLLPTAPAGTDTTWTYASNGNWLSGCMASISTPTSFQAGTGNIVFTGWFKNTLTGTVNCQVGVNMFLNGSITQVEPSGSTGNFVIPANTQTPTQFTVTMNALALNMVAGDQLNVAIGGFSAASNNNPANNCSGTTMYYNSTTHPLKITLPLVATGGGSLATPNPVSGLAVTANPDGTRTLTWTAPTSTASIPAPDFYRVYRDGTTTALRIDVADAVNTTVATASAVGATTLTVAGVTGYSAGQVVLVDTGANQEAMTISSINTTTKTITFTAGMTKAHAVNAPVVLRAVTWTDTATGGTAHTYRVSAVSPALAESAFSPTTGVTG